MVQAWCSKKGFDDEIKAENVLLFLQELCKTKASLGCRLV